MDIYEPEYVKQLFNQMSGSYERMNFITSFGFSILWRKQFIKKLEKSNKSIKVIDLLSGLGENWGLLIKQYPNAAFTALDFSDEMVKKSRSRSLYKLGNRFKVLQQDLLKNKLKPGEFDIITCAFGLKTFNESQLDFLAKTINRVLSENGVFSFIEISKPGNPVLLAVYRFYLKKIVPFLGKLFLGNPEDYKMLWTYTDRFKNCRQVKEIFEKNNLTIIYESYFFGCATGITGKKNTTTCKPAPV